MYWVVFGCVLLLLTRNWKPSRMASSCTNAADFAGKLSISSSVKIPLRRFRSFFDGKGGSVCEFWGSIDALREWPVWNLNRLHVWKSSWVGVQLGKGWQCKNRSDEGLTLETSAFLPFGECLTDQAFLKWRLTWNQDQIHDLPWNQGCLQNAPKMFFEIKVKIGLDFWGKIHELS